MLIEIGLTIQNIAEMGVNQASKFFERVAIAGDSGKHRIYLPPEVFEYLLDSRILSASAPSVLSNISEKSTELGGLIEDISLPKLTVKFNKREFKYGTGNHLYIGQKNI